MSNIIAFLFIALGLMSSNSPCTAEIHLQHNALTVDIQDTTIKDVLEDIRHQGNFSIVALEHTKMGNVRISKKFWNLSIEAGLDRLLSGWNYGISRDRVTGKITTLYLVSERTPPSSHSNNFQVQYWQGQSTQNIKEPAESLLSSELFEEEEWETTGLE